MPSVTPNEQSSWSPWLGEGTQDQTPWCSSEEGGISQGQTQSPETSNAEAKIPQLCECAYFGKRALSWGMWIPGLSQGSAGGFLDRRNLEFAHEHVRFEATGDNIGFGPHGLFSEPLDRYNYHWEPRCYDGSLIRRSIESLKNLGSYNFFTNNCQDFANRVREGYQSLMQQFRNPFS